MIVAIGGPPGSGKTTVAEGFAKAHAYHLVSAGLRFRELAKARGLSLEELGTAADADAEIDRALDRSVLEEVLKEDALGRDVIVEGRIQAPLLAVRRVPCLKVFIDAPLSVRAKRIAGRDHTSVKAAEQAIVRRATLERKRYKSIYGIDLADTSVYDVILDSSDKTPAAIVDLVWAQVEG